MRKYVIIIMFMCFTVLSCKNTNFDSTNTNINTNKEEFNIETVLVDYRCPHKFRIYNNNLYYTSNYGINKMSLSGNEIITISSTGGPYLALTNGKLYDMAASVPNYQLFSVPENNNDLTTLSTTQNDDATLRVKYICIDENYVYWAEYNTDRKVSIIRTLLKNTNNKEKMNTDFSSSDILIENISSFGITHLVIDKNMLYVSEGTTGTIYQIDLKKMEKSIFITNLNSSDDNSISLATTTNYVYAACFGVFGAAESTSIFLQIDKNTKEKKSISYDNIVTKVISVGDYVYWWDGAKLKQLDSISGEISVLADESVNTNTPIIDFSTNGSDIVWARDDKFTIDDSTISIVKINICSGVVQTLSTYNSFKGNYLTPLSMCVDQNNVWLLYNDRISYCPISGGDIFVYRKIRFSARANIVNNSTDLILANDDSGVCKIAKSGVSDSSVVFMDESTFHTMYYDDPFIYVVSEICYDYNLQNPMFKILQFDVNKNELSTLGSFSDGNGGDSIFIEDNIIYIAGLKLFSMSKTDGKLTEIMDLGLGCRNCENIYVKHNKVYLSKEFNGIYEIDLSNRNVNQIFKTSKRRFPSLYVDDRYIYWIETSWRDGGGLYRKPVNGGDITCIYDGNTNHMLYNSGYIYWSNNCGNIYRIKID